jgi:hypothetical protein
MYNEHILDKIDTKILKAIYEKNHTSSVDPIGLIEELKISDEELGDRLELMEKEYVNIIKGSSAPGQSLSNGITVVSLTAKGRQLLRDNELISYEEVKS